MLILALLSLSITLLISEVIYPTLLKESIVLNDNLLESNEDIYTNKVISIDEQPLSNIKKAEFFLSKKDYTSAWIYADLVIGDSKKLQLASEIKIESENKLQSSSVNRDNPKYIETLKYKNLINQNRYLDAYYFCVENQNILVYDHDFLIKMKNSYQELLKNYYSIDIVENILQLPGYSDIQFYNSNRSLKKYNIEKIVEYNNEYYIKNLKINYTLYPYVFIDKFGEIYSKGFRESRREVIEFKKPDIPLDFKDLKLYSKEFYTLINSSLHFNTKLFKNSHIDYLGEHNLANTIVSRLTSYCVIIISFFMGHIFIRKMNYINYLFSYIVILFSVRWVIKKIGLILLYYGLSPAFIGIFLLYSVWLFLLIKNINRLPARS